MVCIDNNHNNNNNYSKSYYLYYYSYDEGLKIIGNSMFRMSNNGYTTPTALTIVLVPSTVTSIGELLILINVNNYNNYLRLND